MRPWQNSAALLISIASIVGCGKSDDKTTDDHTHRRPDAERAMDKLKDATSNAVDATKEKPPTRWRPSRKECRRDAA